MNDDILENDGRTALWLISLVILSFMSLPTSLSAAQGNCGEKESLGEALVDTREAATAPDVCQLRDSLTIVGDAVQSDPAPRSSWAYAYADQLEESRGETVKFLLT